MSHQHIRTIARRYAEDTSVDAAIFDEVVAEDAVFHYPGVPDPLRGREALKQLDTVYRTAFPDYRVTLDELLIDGNKAVARWTLTATHGGPFQGIPASGRAVTLRGASVITITGQHVVEEWGYFDLLGLLQQIGAIPQQ